MSCGAHGALGVAIACGLGLILTLFVGLAFASSARDRDPARRWGRWLWITVGAGLAALLLVWLLLSAVFGCPPVWTWWLPLAGPVVGWVVGARVLKRARLDARRLGL